MAEKNKNDGDDFLIVGIGASAGGLEAYTAFFEHMPADCGMAFVVIIHLHPEHESNVAELIRRKTSLAVLQVTENVRIKPNCVYVIAPNETLAVLHGELQVMPRSDGIDWMPVDYFFRSLAADAGPRAVGIVMSGTGRDGSLGLKAITADLGLTMVQDPDTAQFPGMPASARELTVVDYSLSPDRLAEQLLDYRDHHSVRQQHHLGGEDERGEEAMKQIFTILRAATNHDFSAYKRTTLRRRLERRLNVHQLDNLPDYVRYLQKDPKEAEILFREFLIGVTNFFRDPDAFQALKQKGLTHLFEQSAPEKELRAWIPGCSTGEEAYSLAITIAEFMEEHHVHTDVTIFATDLDGDSVEIARRGEYPASIAADVSQQRLDRYFTKTDQQYRVNHNIRSMIVFSVQDLVKDPPFTRLHILSCRNLLIYLESEMQQKLLPIFHYSLHPGGILFLGTSETTGNFTELFGTLDKINRVYERKRSGLSSNFSIDFPISTVRQLHETQHHPREKHTQPIERVLHRFLLTHFTPAAVFINRKREIVYIHGKTGGYLEPAAGVARLNIDDMARSGLQLPLKRAVREALRTEKEVVQTGVRLTNNVNAEEVTVTVSPVDDGSHSPDLFVVVFKTVPIPLQKHAAVASEESDKDEYVRSLEQELHGTRERLQTTVEELETTNEELKSSLEEYQSTNEELQSSNEELESSKEEMESLNEELTTSNGQLQAKMAELARANEQLSNFLNNLDIPIVFVDNNLHIHQFTESARKIISLIESDVGRHIGHITHSLSYDDLVGDIESIVRQPQQVSRDVQAKDGTPYRMTMSPYRDVDNVMEGVLIVFFPRSQNT